MDTQTVELLGRNYLVNELLRAGLEVALPARDRGVDLIAYADLSSEVSSFVAVPIQIKVAIRRSFVVDRKYEKIANLLLVYVWQFDAPCKAITYALRYPQAVHIAEKMGWTETPSWGRGGYSTTSPTKKLCNLLEEYRMSPNRWRRCIVGESVAKN